MHYFISRSPRLKLIAVAGLVMLGIILLAAVSQESSHASAKPIDVYVDDEKLTFAIDPDNQDGTTVVQMRPLFEALGMEVKWHGESRSVSAVKEGVTILLVLDSHEAEVNGRSVQLERPAVLVNDHTMVPLRFVSESTGALVHWNGVHQEIIVYTPEFLSYYGTNITEVKEMLDQLQAEIDAEYAAAKEAEKEAEREAETPDPSIVLPPAVDEADAVQLDQLQGMYYGGQFDYGGYECGGICWLFYTFLPDQKIVVGQPKGGGPETIDCAHDACLSYSIKDGMLIIDGEEPLSIGVNKDGALEIDDVAMRKVVPVPEGTKLGGEYISQGYYGLVGVTPYASSWTNYMTFYPDGTFTSDQSSLASLDTGNARTDSSSNAETVKGTYKIEANTIELTYDDGTVERYVFAIPPQTTEGRIYVQIGDQSFHIKTE
ncbi:stalk domain-containing protein [Paenibacillus senegalensis]|uniref:stalk domain-containing protein n=1 Tax=Paenibacillus senegalensis TaxID=1465766 RepID=UPI00028861D6|nr:stalk domain-containing protein [Paenibacillus senegalensis]